MYAKKKKRTKQCSALRFSGFPQYDLETEGQIWRVGFLFPFYWDVGSLIHLVLSANPGQLTLNFMSILLCLPSHCRSPGIRSVWHYIGFLHGSPELDSCSQNFMAIVFICWAFSLSSAHFFFHEDYYTCATLRSHENKTFAVWL